MSDDDSRRDPVEQLAESFVERLRRGESPSVSEYVARSPENAEEIRDLFPALVEMESAKQSHPSLDGPPTTHADTPERLGDYRILRLLGAGGMGVVYEAERESLRSHVALKVLHPRFRIDPTYLARFRNEARSAAQLHHTNIVTVFDYGEQDGVFYYAMQYIPGQGLDKVLDDARRLRQARSSNGKSANPIETRGADSSVATITEALLSGRFAEETPALVDPDSASTERKLPANATSPSPSTAHGPDSSGSIGEMSDRGRYYREVARIGLQLADALAYAHARGVIHRDIKPANLILDGRGNVWVTDFGLAKFADQDLSNSQDIVGTLRYMSPERFKGVTSPSVDIYALGATLYELLTLRPVFESADKLRLIDAITNRDPVRPREIEPQLPLDLETLIQKALAKDPQQRFTNALELRDELRRFLENRPIRSRPAPMHERYWRWCRRNPLLAASNLTAALLALIITIGSTVAAYRSSAQNQALRIEKGKADLEAKRAAKAELDAKKETFTALVSQAKARRFSRRVGQRFESLDAIAQSNELLSTLKLPAEEQARHRQELRNLAISCLALPDIRTIKRLTRQEGHSYAVDNDGTMLADVGRDGEVVVRRLGDGSEVARLPGNPRPLSDPVFSPDGRYLIFGEARGQAGKSLVGWRLGDPAPSFEMAFAAVNLCFRFSPDGGLLAVAPLEPENHPFVDVFQFPSGRKRYRLALPETNSWGVEFEFSPDGRNLAVNAGTYGEPAGQIVTLHDVESGRQTASFDAEQDVWSLAWHPDNDVLAIGCTDSNDILLWDVRSNRLVKTITEQREGAPSLAFNRTGEILVSVAQWENAGLRLFHPRSGRELFQLPATGTLFRQAASDGRILSLAGRGDLLEIVPGRECRTLTRGPVADNLKFYSVSVHPGGRLVAGGNEAGVVLWDLETGHEVGFLPLKWTFAWFEPVSGALWTSSSFNGVNRWPVSPVAGGYQVGPPVRRHVEGHWDRPVSGSRDGRVVALANRAGAVVFQGSRIREFFLPEPERDIRGVAVSPDGRWVVTIRHVTHEAKLWDVPTGKVVREFRGPVVFSPDGRHLLAAGKDGPFRVWDVKSWEPGPELVGSPGHIDAFSPDGRLLAIGDGITIRLVDTATGRDLATLDGPTQGAARMIDFTPDGNTLVATNNGSPASVHVWDLAGIRRKLGELDLDWGGSTPSTPSPRHSEPIRKLEVVGFEEVASAQLRAARARDSAQARLANNPSDGEVYYELGKALNVLGEPAAAFVHLTTARQLLPTWPEVSYQRARAGARLGRWPEVIADTEDALKGSYETARCHVLRGQAFQGLGRHEEAVRDLTAVLERFPEDFEIYRRRAESLAALGRRAEAEADRRKADELSTPRDLNDLAWMLANGLEGERDPARALPLIRRAVEKAPNEADLLNTLGVVLYRNALYEEAIPVLERSLAASKSDTDAFDLYFLAMAQHRLGDRAKARAYFEQAVRWQVDHPDARTYSVAELKVFRAEAEAVLAAPPLELPADVFAR
jgi:serine/threonine protein kinase/WD40 repeat protein/tetratricopeptide (TPR) repeat protein